MPPLRIFIGWDGREPIAFSVLAHSILRRASHPVAIVPLVRSSLMHLHWRPRGPLESTEFAFTRFLVPHLSDYRGTSIFMDSDMLCLVDIGDVLLHVLAEPCKAVYVCQHDYIPKAGNKFLGQPQTAYPRKNWSSFMVFDNARCRALTPDYVNQASGLDLHRLHWTTETQIGALPLAWNWLVGEYGPNPHAKILHYTRGGPWFANAEHHDSEDAVWHAEHQHLSGGYGPALDLIARMAGNVRR